MMLERTRMHLLRALLALGAAVLTQTAAAQAYPARPIRWVVTYPPGGTTDVIARNVAQVVGDSLGVAIVVENKAGAGGVIGMDAVAKSAPDGYTFLVSDASLATAPSLYARVPFDPLKDLVAIGQFVTVPHVIVVNAALPVKDVRDLIAQSRREPGKLNFSSGGIGSPLHLAGEVFRSATGVEWTHVPYKGANPAILAVVSGEAQVAAPSVPGVLGQIAGGKLRALAVTSPRRLDLLKDVPTVVELGFPGAQMFGWVGLHAPAGTPSAVLARMQAAVAQALASPALQARLSEQGAALASGAPDAYGRLIAEQITLWRKVVAEAGIKPE
jgi:tripartite-type tricarboxylate transporter receptor subunit TctC